MSLKVRKRLVYTSGKLIRYSLESKKRVLPLSPEHKGQKKRAVTIESPERRSPRKSTTEGHLA